MYVALVETMSCPDVQLYQVSNSIHIPDRKYIIRYCIICFADIIKKYNPNVKGYSLGTGSSNAGLNVAESGAIAQ